MKELTFDAFNLTMNSRVNKSGPVYRVSMELSQHDYRMLEESGLEGIFAVALVQIEDCPTEETKPKSNYFSSLIKNGLFNNSKMLACLGSDSDYQSFIRKHKSAFSNEYSEYKNGEGRCVYAHVRRVKDGSGMAIKPTFSGIPLTQEEHNIQHTRGESYLKPLEWWTNQAAGYRVKWGKHELKRIFKVDSLNDIHESDFVDWCKEREILL